MWGIVHGLKTPLCCFFGLWLVDLYTSNNLSSGRILGYGLCDGADRQEVAACLTLFLYRPSKILAIFMITPICAWILVTYRTSPLHVNTGSQYNNSHLCVDAGGLLLGSGNLQNDFPASRFENRTLSF
jgi:hypothetical protein